MEKRAVKGFARYAAALLACAAVAVGCSRGESGLTVGYDDFVRLGGITYEANYPEAGGSIAENVDRSRAYARTRVRFQDEAAPARPGGRYRDGDAGQLEPGTPVYRLRGYDPRFRLAARSGDGWSVYEVSRNPKAATGEDLMDVRGKAVRVDLYETKRFSKAPRGPRFMADTIRKGSVEDPEEVEALVGSLLRADVERFPGMFTGDDYIVVRLRDGTASAGAYDPASGRLSTTVGGETQGIVVPAGPREHLDVLSRNASAKTGG